MQADGTCAARCGFAGERPTAIFADVFTSPSIREPCSLASGLALDADCYFPIRCLAKASQPLVPNRPAVLLRPPDDLKPHASPCSRPGPRQSRICPGGIFFHFKLPIGYYSGMSPRNGRILAARIRGFGLTRMAPDLESDACPAVGVVDRHRVDEKSAGQFAHE